MNQEINNTNKSLKHSSIENWINSELSDGLIDIKLDISNKRNTSVRLIENDILNIDALVSAGRTKALPYAKGGLSNLQLEIINSVTIT